MGPCIHQLTTVWLTSIATCCDIGAVTADSFQAQFSSPVHYGLAIAGISLGATIAAALFVLLIYCLVKRRQREDEKDATRSDTEVKNSINSRGGAGVVAGASNFGPMALPGVAKPAEAVRNGGKVQTADAGNGAGVRGGSGSGGGDSGGRKRTRPVPANVQYTNPAFSSSSNQLDGAAVVGSTTSLFRNSSLLRPMSYTASLESNKPSDRPDSLAPGKSSAALIQHPQVRTSPATTLDPRTFLSQDGLGPTSRRAVAVSDYSKRLSYAEQQPQQQQQQQQPQQHQKRLSYAEQRAKTGSSVELVSGQVFASSPVSYSATSSSSSGQDRSLPRQSAAMVRVLPTQIEEELLGRKKHPAPPPPPQAVQVGPSFPKTATRSDSFARQQKPQPEQVEDPVPPRHRGLNRVNLGGEEDGRSVTSTVLKQEALQAFEFLDTLE
ncbi:hypothetical protein BOX15_Mlig004237g2 [Macrostomum lignano]|uniref:Uncharacterized protein n=1 Tax=Macrostomum lignano TaxID=282301 RepID=A0A267GET8_9PLAT|nr:hypothetical protein BOX15_Mlig004237g2 [Macrostomum lignano]